MKIRNFSANFAAFLAASLFGASVVATRVAVQEIPPLSLAFLRFGQGGLILLLCLFIGARDLLAVKRHDLPFLAILGAILFTVFPVTFNIGLRLTEASRGALMLATMPLWSAWLARAARRERLILRQVAGILLTITGVGLVLAERGLRWQGTASAFAGDGLMLLTALCGAIYGVLAQRILARYTALTVTTYAMVFGAFFLVGEQLIRQGFVLFRSGATPPRARDGADRHLSVAHAHKDFGAGTGHGISAKIEEEQVRRWVYATERTVEHEGRQFERRRETLAQHDLEYVTGGDVLFRLADHGFVFFLRGVGCRLRHGNAVAVQMFCVRERFFQRVHDR